MEVTCWGEHSGWVSLDGALRLVPRSPSFSANKRRESKRVQCTRSTALAVEVLTTAETLSLAHVRILAAKQCWCHHGVWAMVTPSVGIGSMAPCLWCCQPQKRQKKVDVTENPRGQETHGSPFLCSGVAGRAQNYFWRHLWVLEFCGRDKKSGNHDWWHLWPHFYDQQSCEGRSLGIFSLESQMKRPKFGLGHAAGKVIGWGLNPRSASSCYVLLSYFSTKDPHLAMHVIWHE